MPVLLYGVKAICHITVIAYYILYAIIHQFYLYNGTTHYFAGKIFILTHCDLVTPYGQQGLR